MSSHTELTSSAPDPSQPDPNVPAGSYGPGGRTFDENLGSGDQPWARPDPEPSHGRAEYVYSDEMIAGQIREWMSRHTMVSSNYDIEIIVHDGEVTLRGLVDDEQIIGVIGAFSNQVPGVTVVHNELQLRWS